MRIQVDDVKLFFDVEGAKLRPDGSAMRQVPTLLLLHYRRHLGESRLEARMVEARTTMQEQQRRHLAHRRSVRPEFRSLDVKEQCYVVYLYAHEPLALRVGSR